MTHVLQQCNAECGAVPSSMTASKLQIKYRIIPLEVSFCQSPIIRNGQTQSVREKHIFSLSSGQCPRSSIRMENATYWSSNLIVHLNQFHLLLSQFPSVVVDPLSFNKIVIIINCPIRTLWKVYIVKTVQLSCGGGRDVANSNTE